MNKSIIKVGSRIQVVLKQPDREHPFGTITKGTVSSLTSIGAYVKHNPLHDGAEWFPFDSNNLIMQLV